MHQPATPFLPPWPAPMKPRQPQPLTLHAVFRVGIWAKKPRPTHRSDRFADLTCTPGRLPAGNPRHGQTDPALDGIDIPATPTRSAERRGHRQNLDEVATTARSIGSGDREPSAWSRPSCRGLPLIMASWKFPPGAGCRIVLLQPSEKSPLDPIRIAQWRLTPYPKGVFTSAGLRSTVGKRWRCTGCRRSGLPGSTALANN